MPILQVEFNTIDDLGARVQVDMLRSQVAVSFDDAAITHAIVEPLGVEQQIGLLGGVDASHQLRRERVARVAQLTVIVVYVVL